MADLARFDRGQMSGIHADLFCKRFLRDPSGFELTQWGLQGHTAEVCLHVRESVDIFALCVNIRLTHLKA